MLATIGCPTLAWRRRRQKLSFMWDLLHGGGPPSLRSQVPVSSRCSYSFRNPLTQSLPSCRLVVWSLFFILLLLCLFLCLSLLFVAPPSAHFCKLSISFFFLISFLTVCYRSRLSLAPSSPEESFHVSLWLRCRTAYGAQQHNWPHWPRRREIL